jgi:integrase
VIRAYGVLAGMIDIAVRDRRLPSNPARGVNLPRKRAKERHYLSHGQVQLLADQSRSNGTLVLFLAYTGLRWGEAVGLRVNNVDTLRRRILVRANAVNVRGTIVPGTPKTHESRSVPFPRSSPNRSQSNAKGSLGINSSSAMETYSPRR